MIGIIYLLKELCDFYKFIVALQIYSLQILYLSIYVQLSYCCTNEEHENKSFLRNIIIYSTRI